MTDKNGQIQTKNQDIETEFAALLKTLTVDQMRFVIARQECKTDREAAEKIRVRRQTISEWGEPVKRACELIAMDGVLMAKEIRHKNLAKAMAVKVSGLESNSEKVRQDVATEVIEWELGKALQRAETTHEVKVVWDWKR